MPPADIKAFVEDVVRRAPACDAVYLPCPQWQAAQTVDALERDLGIAAISYSHASFFAAFKALGIKEAIKGHGRLPAALADAAARSARLISAFRCFGSRCCA